MGQESRNFHTRTRTPAHASGTHGPLFVLLSDSTRPLSIYPPQAHDAETAIRSGGWPSEHSASSPGLARLESPIGGGGREYYIPSPHSPPESMRRIEGYMSIYGNNHSLESLESMRRIESPLVQPTHPPHPGPPPVIAFPGGAEPPEAAVDSGSSGGGVVLAQLEAQLAMLEGFAVPPPRDDPAPPAPPSPPPAGSSGGALDRSTSPRHAPLTPDQIAGDSRSPSPWSPEPPEVPEEQEFRSPEHRLRFEGLELRLAREQEARKGRLAGILEARAPGGTWLPKEEMHRRLVLEFERRRKEVRAIIGPDVDGTYPYDRACNIERHLEH